MAGSIPFPRLPRVPTGTSWPGAKASAGVPGQFRDELFHDLIRDLPSTKFWWSRAARCPCGTTTPDGNDTRKTDPTCTLCNKGWYFRHPEPWGKASADGECMLIDAVFSDVHWAMDFQETGVLPNAGCTVTVSPQHRLGFLDRLWSPQQLAVFDQILIRQTGNTPFPIGHTDSSFRYMPVRILSIRTTTTIYNEEVDWTQSEEVDGGVDLTWTSGGSSPAVGEKFSVIYEGMPIWRVVRRPYAIQQSTKDARGGSPRTIWLPVTAAVELEHHAVTSTP